MSQEGHIDYTPGRSRVQIAAPLKKRLKFLQEELFMIRENICQCLQGISACLLAQMGPRIVSAHSPTTTD